MQMLKKVGFASVATLVSMQQALAIDFGGAGVQANVSGSANTADKTIQNLVSNAMVFLGIIAVLYGIYGGFLILTAGGEDDKVKKGKTILIQVAIGLVVIFLANSIVQMVLSKVLTPGA
ncbi:hypothetical protein GW819_03830 [Candidatus Gracilibacteria bacterium]|nr:hypothetical protein [bacterium]NDK19946.1 hypothetical protein [Candidatus Gracilibacteria bacterium]